MWFQLFWWIPADPVWTAERGPRRRNHNAQQKPEPGLSGNTQTASCAASWSGSLEAEHGDTSGRGSMAERRKLRVGSPRSDETPATNPAGCASPELLLNFLQVIWFLLKKGYTGRHCFLYFYLELKTFTHLMWKQLKIKNKSRRNSIL